VPPLSALAVENLRRWYAQDFEFLRACETWLQANGAPVTHSPVTHSPATHDKVAV
jgi:hypothetical protein